MAHSHVPVFDYASWLEEYRRWYFSRIEDELIMRDHQVLVDGLIKENEKLRTENERLQAANRELDGHAW